MKRSFLLAMVIGLCAAVPAQANRWPDWVVSRAMQVADGHWPVSPCYGRHAITWLRGSELDALQPGGMWGYAAGDCRVWIAWDRIDPAGVYRPGVFLCAALEHEFGHNAGMGHSSDPDDVMYSEGAKVPPADCKAAFQPRHYRWVRWAW